MGLWEVVKLGTQVNDFCLRFGEVCFIVLFKLYQGGLRVLELSWATSLIIERKNVSVGPKCDQIYLERT